MMEFRSVLVLCAVAMSPVQNASALELLSLTPSGAFLEGAATFSTGLGSDTGIVLPDGDASSSFASGFVLPPEYPTGSVIRLGIAWHTDATTPCSLELRPDFLSVARFGQAPIVGPRVNSGLAPADGTSILDAEAADVTDLKIYTITPPDDATPLQAFDVINFGLIRSPDGTGDTCAGNLYVQGIGITTE